MKRWLPYKWGKNDASFNRIGGNLRFKFQALGNWVVSMLGSMQGNSYGEKERQVKQLCWKLGEQ